MTIDGRFHFPSILTAGIGVIFALTIILVTLISARERRMQIDKRAALEAEYQAGFTAQYINDSLEHVDSFLRVAASMIEESPSGLAVVTDKTDQRIRKELLLTPQVESMVVLDPEAHEIWRSPSAQFDSSWFSHIVAVHRQTGISFSIMTRKQASAHYHIHISRSVSDENGDIRAIVDTIVSPASLLPSVEDPLLHNPLRISIYTADREEILRQPDDYLDVPLHDSWLDTPDGGTAGKTKILGGVHVHIDKKWAASLYQVASFPFYAMVVISLEDELIFWRRQTLQIVVVLLGLGLLAGVLGKIMQQRGYAKRMREHNVALKEVNQHLVQTNAERALLIKEVHHRVKNNLAIISGIISLIIDRGGPYTEQTLEGLSARILAIQKVHDRLYKNDDFHSIPIQEYLTGLAETIVESFCSFPVFIDVRIAPFSLSTNQAVPLGIFATEVITNAIKYGLQPGGTLRIVGEITTDGVVISFANDGKPFSDGPKGLGSELISSLAQQLGAALNLETGRETCYQLRFKL
ncbi:sensor histidine kinase [Sediminispirochaeta smaragdinae]|uniref:histidine kinase n=1 Tax=Sediminispirochaeta smaragdinae (strain DSM 11293 / JCM 15392 / SEBR 4228) TaxID=573413 RepID=E1R4N8_SEDSS|nr:sensor histidine kinase [Sediminispirochaeta smaragdinae]ADK82126.1 signal transduction histidine kinase [Sediminispirochaeta smaragdinae DSM 11293]